MADNPGSPATSSGTIYKDESVPEKGTKEVNLRLPRKKISLKTMTLNNDKQKINDALGNPVIIGIVVIWRVVNTTKAVFNVDNYTEYLSIQCDSALRNIVRLYPYDTFGDDNEKTLRGSSQEIAERLRKKYSQGDIAGLEILDQDYPPALLLVAAAMLQRQQASQLLMQGR